MADQQTRQPGRPLDPTRLPIPPGLDSLPRQIGLFPAFRAAMLESASLEAGLGGAGWRGRDVDDFGVMLIEMWAYVCDVLSFYDQFLAGESYLRTAMRTAAAHRLASLIGYIPRPAVAALVDLALSLDGRKPVTIPAGSAFRSGSWDTEKPQVFTVMEAAERHPLVDLLTLRPQPASALPGTSGSVTLSSLTFRPGTVTAKEGDVVLVKAGAGRAGAVVQSVETTTDPAGNPITRVTFADPIRLPAGTPYSQISLHRAANSPGIRYKGYAYDDKYIGVLWLDTLYRHLKVGNTVLMRQGDYVRWYVVTLIDTYDWTIMGSKTITTSSGGSTTTTTIPAVTTPVTVLYLDADWTENDRGGPNDAGNWTSYDVNDFTLYTVLTPAGSGLGEATPTLSANDVLKVSGSVPTLADEFTPHQFILKDLDEQAVLIDGSLAANRMLTVADASKWQGNLTPPVTVYGALVRATRGERVTGEIIGVGDGSIANQSFKLKKKPLTYVTATTDSGVMSTLTVYVNGVKWTEVPRFYGRGPDETIYIVRQNTEGDSFVTFGDGLRGARLTSGAVVTANYYFGAGAAAPPAGLVTQLVTPIRGVSTVTNPLPAFGGADAEDESGTKRYAPRSALMLGRAVSLVDYEAVAAGTTGVRVARAEWRWSLTQQRPVVTIYYIGEGDLGSLISDRLSGYSAEGVPFEIIAAQSLPRTLNITVVVNAAYIPENVAADVTELLVGENGALKPETLGIGQPLIRSKILALVADVPGVVAPRTITVSGSPMPASLKSGPGNYFDIVVQISTELE